MEEEFQHKTYKALWLRRVRAAVSLAQILAQIRADICFPNQNHVMLAFERRECRAFVLGTLGMTFWMGRVDVQEMFPVYGKIPFESGEGRTWFYSQRFGVQIIVLLKRRRTERQLRSSTIMGRRPLCELCSLHRPSRLVKCSVCGLHVGPGCVPQCLAQEFPVALCQRCAPQTPPPPPPSTRSRSRRHSRSRPPTPRTRSSSRDRPPLPRTRSRSFSREPEPESEPALALEAGHVEYKEGDPVEYYSSCHKEWMNVIVLQADDKGRLKLTAEPGCSKFELKPNKWLSKWSVDTKIRPRSKPDAARS